MFQTYKGGDSDISDISYSTQPEQPKVGEGPLVESAGAQPMSHAFDKTSPSWDNVGKVPRGGSMDSPTDK